MKTIIKILILLFFASGCSESLQVNVDNLRCEYKINPFGVDIETPRLSWILQSNHRGVKQSAYQIIVASSLEKLNANEGDIWNTKKVKSDKSIQIYYEGKPLESNHKYFWKVKVWDQNGETNTSTPAFWTTGLFNDSDWKAKWIGLDKAVGEDNPDTSHRKLSARMLRHEFKVDKKIESATAFISGLGLFEFYINGEKIGDQVLSPGLTEYNKRTFYMAFDVTNNMQLDKNAIGVILGNGRYFAPRTSYPTPTRTYGFPKVICQLEIKYDDGTTSTIVTDELWKLTTNGPTRNNNEYDGEFYDARMELNGWSKFNYNDKSWINAELVDKPGELLVSQPNEPIKIMEELIPIEVNEAKPGEFIFDMGQNMVGWVELFVNGKKGDKVTLRFSETLNDDGSLYLDNIREAEVTDTYILKGDGDEKWEPKFTYHGFRFVEMIGYPGTPKLSSIKGKVVYDALEESGSFTCSNSLINSIYKNAYWVIRGNYRSMPTDCPQRDERQGWLGDRAAECIGESFIFDISKLYNKWNIDIMDAQQESGSIPDVAPSYWPIYSDNTTWPGTYLFVADMLYSQYGDLKAIETHYPNMQKWIVYMSQFLTNGIMPKDTYGDWCVPPGDIKSIHSSDPLNITSSEYLGTAYFYYELKLMEKFARLLGRVDDATEYSETANEMKIAFNEKFLDKNYIIYSNNTHTVNILALAFDLVPEEYKAKIVDNLLQKILVESDSHIGNGLVGGQRLMRTLTNSGHADVAYTLAVQSTYPSWGYMVSQGATTIWELWNGDHGDPSMNSGSHVALLGDLVIWYYEDLAGIKADPEIPAFKHIIMKPQVLGDLTYVTALYNSVYGEIKSNWELKNSKFNWSISIPANTTATIYVPTLEKENVMEGDKLASKSEGVKFIRWDGNRAVFEIESGNYSFTSHGTKMNVTKPYVSKPQISPDIKILMKGDKFTAEIKCKENEAVIRYTLDGREPNSSSQIYNKPLIVTNNTTIIAKAFIDGFKPSMISKMSYDFIDPHKNGVNWNFYEGRFTVLPDFEKLQPVKSGEVFQFGFDKIDLPQQIFALQQNSYIKIDKEGEYDFTISSNDGSKLYVNDKLIINNDGEHVARQISGSIYLTKGKHLISVEYFQSGGNKILQLYYKSDKIGFQLIPGSVLFKSKN
ncbi:MAG: family 78 glycoside hydrolase catalytic domain [Draconibacterium sp.]|nr:family 78 glycoside hydrolase catalytic domain [Draconibacterium sp.]